MVELVNAGADVRRVRRYLEQYAGDLVAAFDELVEEVLKSCVDLTNCTGECTMADTDVRDPRVIQADPTKELFAFMLVRDLTLRDAIGDLVDNSVDGAKRLRPDSNAGRSRNRLAPDQHYDGLKIEIHARENEFSIIDNCGGIPSELARDYAFRFGRPKDTPGIPGSVGQFGIGMNRALFKLGEHFEIRSTSERSSFVVEQSVDDWINTKDWTFHFKELDERGPSDNEFDVVDRGTEIRVSLLREDTKASFKLDKFIESLRIEIQREQLYNLYRGLRISINGHELESHQMLSLLESDEIRAAHWEKTFQVDRERSKGTLHVDMYAGVSEDDPDYAGWYVFCNDRLILGGDQTGNTGWGEGGRIPRFHTQFSRFRGYAFFNSDNADLLPWNTVKNNMDVENPYFQAVRLEMIKLMRPIIDFLNKVHDERQKIDAEDERVLAVALERATRVTLFEVKHLGSSFIFPRPTANPRQTNVRIAYLRPKEQVDEAKEFFGVKSPNEVGNKTFSYWYGLEVGEE